MTIHDLPAVNASLNALSGVLLVIGFTLIHNKRIEAHRRVMIAAFATSSLFLICYVVYHAQVGSVPFTRQGFVRPLYFTSALVLGIALLALSVRFARTRTEASARALFFGSITYLPLLWIVMIANRL